MPKDYLNQPYNELRRKDRGKDDEWIKAFLQRSPYGVMALSYEEQPFVNSNIFVYDESRTAIYIHNSFAGRTPATVAANPRVCFHVSEMGRFLPAEKAMEFSVEFRGVTVFGKCQIVSDEGEAKYGLQLLLDKYFPHLEPEKDYSPTSAEDLKITAVLRIDIESWSGKEKRGADDFPGAFTFGER
ncbi:MAG TPA: pyridoxamine 5'-phosphate oxidase family protein [Chloroflexi bacterium]|nr:pyridoxamine 5'-phosphate oxidase family protein [Chloroflexota bacterium]